MEVLATGGLFGFEIQANNPIENCCHYSKNFLKRKKKKGKIPEKQKVSLWMPSESVFGEAVFEQAMIAVGKSFGIS